MCSRASETRGRAPFPAGAGGALSSARGRLLAASLALLPAGCLTLDAPESFVVIERGSRELKAITPEEAKLWVRDFPDPDGADLEFWTRALRTDFTENRGYTLVEERAIQDARGRKGTELLLEMTAGGLPQRYLAALFVIDGWLFANTIRVAEFVAPATPFERYAAGVRKAIPTIRKRLF